MSKSTAEWARERMNASRSRQPSMSELFGTDADEPRVTWQEVDAEFLRGAIHVWTVAGNAITLGRTSDGGALSITLLAGGQPYKLYPTTAQQAEDMLGRLGAAVEARKG